jgi:hypothetical protein
LSILEVFISPTLLIREFLVTNKDIIKALILSNFNCLYLLIKHIVMIYSKVFSILSMLQDSGLA